ncbi:MAG: hypothetical protein QGF53_09340 [Alphaproteobacteria bacterium]|nr:hypothetical protein [Alphaproteobacteria bacterium]
MLHANNTANGSGLFARKGEAKPTPDYVPMLKTVAPAKIEAEAAAHAPLPEARPLPGSEDGLGSLIMRRTAPRDPAPEVAAVLEEDARIRAEAAKAEQQAEALADTVSEQADNGMLYESLRMGLPMPDLSAAKTESDDEPAESADVVSFEEAARQHVARPTDGAAGETPRRRKLTLRLAQDDFEILKAHADKSDRTYQDILATATKSYLDALPAEKPGMIGGLLRRFR